MPDEKCETCRFYRPLHQTAGECRRYPPQLFQLDGEVRPYFPPMESIAWCGEFAPKPLPEVK